MQNIDGILKTHRISGAPRIAVVRSHNFEHAGAAKAFKWFGRGIGLAFLSGEQRMSNMSTLTARGKERKYLRVFQSSEWASVRHSPIYYYTYILILGQVLWLREICSIR